MGRRQAATKNHEHPGDPHLRNFNSAMQVQRERSPSKTITSGGEAPQMSMPLLPGGKVANVGGAYAALLSRELPREPPSPRPGARLASFFCCGGGIDLGFRSAGFELAFANDISARAVETFGANLGHAPLHRDIREVGAADYPASPVDVVTGGFPCVTFSMAGKRLGVVDDLHGKLYLELCRVIKEMSPRYFVAENVEGILSANGGAAVKYVQAAFLRLGYRTDYQLVNMAEHGVPQTRKRVIFVGVRLDQWRGSFRFPAKTHRLHDDKLAPRWLPPARTLREAIGDLPPPGERLLGMMHGDAAEKLARGPGVSSYQSSKPRRGDRPSHSQTTQGGVLLDEQDTVSNHGENNAAVSPTHAMSKRVARGGRPAPTVVSEATNVQPLFDPGETRTGTDVVGARNPDFFNPVRGAGQPSPTMTAGGQTEVTERSGGMRRMTVRECARVQSFPDWYDFKGSQGDGYTLVGNAVPPLYAKRLAMAILEYDERELAR